MRGGVKTYLKKSLFVVALGFLVAPLLPTFATTPTSSQESRPYVSSALAITNDEQKEFISNYKNSLKIIGKYVTSAKIADRTDTSDPVTITLPPDIAGGPDLVFTLSKFQVMTVPKLDEEGNTLPAEDSYVTDMFMFFDSTSPADKDLTLVMEYGGIGAVFPSDTVDASDISKAVYGDPSKCRTFTSSDDPNSAEFTPSTCQVSVAAISNPTEREETWYNFADRVIPEELQPNNCSVAASTKPEKSPSRILTSTLGVGKAQAIGFGEIVGVIGDAATSIGGAVIDTATTVGEAVVGAAGGAVNFCNTTLDSVNGFMNNTIFGKVWGFVAPGTKYAIAYSRFAAGTYSNALRAFFPGIAKLMGVTKAAGGIDVEALKESCALSAITKILSLDIFGAVANVIKCFVGNIVSGIHKELEGVFKDIVGISLAPIKPQKLNLSFFVGTAHAGYVDDLRNENHPLVDVWKLCMTIVNIVVVLALLLIAFSNIFHISINTYGVKKALPALIIGVVGANASLFIIRFLVDICSALSIWAAELGGKDSITSLISVGFLQALWNATTLNSLTGFVLLLVAPLIGLYYGFLIIAFMWIFFKRLVVIYILAMISPLAFVAYGLPPFQKYFFQWWEYYLRYLFMLPAVLFGMAIFLRASDALTAGNRTILPNNVSIISTIFMFVLATFILKIPKALSKGAMDVGATFKKVLGAVPGVVAGAQGAHGWASNRKIESLTSKSNPIVAGRRNEIASQVKALRAAGDRDGARRLAADYANEVKNNKDALTKKFTKGRTAKFLGAARGFTNIAANPDKTVQSWYNDRVSAVQKGSDLAASTFNIPGTGYNLSDVVAGKQGGYASKSELTRKLAGEVTTVEGIENFMSDGPSKDLYNAFQKYEKSSVFKNPDGTVDKGKLAAFRARVIEAKKWEKMESVLSDMANSPEMEGVFDATDLNALKNSGLFGIATISAGYEQKVKIIRQQRSGKKTQNLVDQWDGEGEGDQIIQKMELNPNALNAFHANRVNEAEQVSSTIRTPQELQDLGHSMDQLSTNLVGLMNRWQVPELERSDQDMDGLRRDTSAAIKALTGKDIPADGVNDRALGKLAEMLAAATNSGVHSGNITNDNLAEMQRKLMTSSEAGARTLESNKEIATTLNGLDPQTLEQLTRALSGAVNSEELASLMEQHLSGHFDKLTKSLGQVQTPEERHQMVRAIGEQMQQAISGRGPRSMNSLLGKMGTVWAKQIGVSTASGIDELSDEVRQTTQKNDQSTNTPPSGGTY